MTKKDLLKLCSPVIAIISILLINRFAGFMDRKENSSRKSKYVNGIIIKKYKPFGGDVFVDVNEDSNINGFCISLYRFNGSFRNGIRIEDTLKEVEVGDSIVKEKNTYYYRVYKHGIMNEYVYDEWRKNY